MKDFLTLITNRRSCRKFKDQEVSEEKISELKKAVLLSPTSKNNRPWEFIFITDKSLIEELSLCKPHGAAFLKNAPLAVVILPDPNKSDVWIEDTSIAATYLQLAAENLGLGSCWVQIRKRMYDKNISASERTKQILNIPEQYEVASIIAIGSKEKERAPYSDKDLLMNRVHMNHWELP